MVNYSYHLSQYQRRHRDVERGKNILNWLLALGYSWPLEFLRFCAAVLVEGVGEPGGVGVRRERSKSSAKSSSSPSCCQLSNAESTSNSGNFSVSPVTSTSRDRNLCEISSSSVYLRLMAWPNCKWPSSMDFSNWSITVSTLGDMGSTCASIPPVTRPLKSTMLCHPLGKPPPACFWLRLSAANPIMASSWGDGSVMPFGLTTAFFQSFRMKSFWGCKGKMECI